MVSVSQGDVFPLISVQIDALCSRWVLNARERPCQDAVQDRYICPNTFFRIWARSASPLQFQLAANVIADAAPKQLGAAGAKWRAISANIAWYARALTWSQGGSSPVRLVSPANCKPWTEYSVSGRKHELNQAEPRLNQVGTKHPEQQNCL